MSRVMSGPMNRGPSRVTTDATASLTVRDR